MPMRLNPFASAFIPGGTQKSGVADTLQTSPVVVGSRCSQPESPVAVPVAIPASSQAKPSLPAVGTPFAAPQAASTNSSADEALQLEFEDLFQRGEQVTSGRLHVSGP